ncbi:cell division protease FtsH [Pseudobutyrivibrio sp. YE44]|uniref:ATP-dependent zinc metalloprotease FtsH n=1 Tax=Pseudobutyrivibrio sp. YE44 TaxID=1520802 RepID=UPI00088FDA34|nr:ATP-dependent zinc metalloprotease FtsH [Pseudobutyrivibrio sp. YE44]SDB43241.1 cell division protease FtsH [Pseudobutyrivibrio sp. YE44]
MNDNNNNQNGGDKKNNRQPFYTLGILVLVALFFTSMMYKGASSSSNQEITYTEFLNLVEEDKVDSVTFKDDTINIELKKGESYGTTDEETKKLQQLYEATGQQSKVSLYTAYIRDDDLLPLLKKHKVEIDGTIADSTAAIIYNILSFVLPIVLLWVVLGFLMKKMGGGPMGVGKSNAKLYNMEKATGITFKDVAGQDEAKESVQEMVDFLHNPKKYTEIGAKLPKGALLVGPPGTGKTLLAKAVAGEAGVPFFSLAGSDFVEMFVGVGASRVRDLFKEAQKVAPCIVFIDEIDAIGKSRDAHYGGGNDEREQTLNQLLSEMDGFDSNKGLLILAATNRPEVLDKALLRPGRFDRRIIVDRPDQKGRLEILKVHAKDVKMDETVDLDALALASVGLVGSDLANIINEAAILAVKAKRQYVTQKDLFEAFELVAVGGKEKKDRAMSEKERKIVSYHEVGHALVSALQKEAEPVQKITIVPRTMGALGYTLQTPEEEKFLETKDELIAKIVTYMGGRAAEDIKFGSYTSGAANDIEQATKIARAMVTRFGMSEKFGMMGLATVESQYLDGRASLICGDATAGQIDTEVLKMITDAYAKAKELLLENMESLDKISDYLFEHETITGKEFMKIFREIKGIPEPEEKPKDADTSSEATATEGEASQDAEESPKVDPENVVTDNIFDE